MQVTGRMAANIAEKEGKEEGKKEGKKEEEEDEEGEEKEEFRYPLPDASYRMATRQVESMN